jgi:hypothetical protein
MPKPKLRVRLLVLVGLVVFGAAGLVLLARYGLHGLADRLRKRN